MPIHVKSISNQVKNRKLNHKTINTWHVQKTEKNTHREVNKDELENEDFLHVIQVVKIIEEKKKLSGQTQKICVLFGVSNMRSLALLFLL